MQLSCFNSHDFMSLCEKLLSIYIYSNYCFVNLNNQVAVNRSTKGGQVKRL